VRRVHGEREALKALAGSSPFVVKLVHCFRDVHSLYMLLELVDGGELFELLSSERRVPPAAAAFYAGSVLLALDAIHKRGIAYRDLKPENVMLDGRGHVRIVDFGFARNVRVGVGGARAFSFVGTAEYMAPEIIGRRGHGREVDYWSLGRGDLKGFRR
jgi:protein kinase A